MDNVLRVLNYAIYNTKKQIKRYRIYKKRCLPRDREGYDKHIKEAKEEIKEFKEAIKVIHRHMEVKEKYEKIKNT
jgi:hypothetical protein